MAFDDAAKRDQATVMIPERWVLEKTGVNPPLVSILAARADPIAFAVHCVDVMAADLLRDLLAGDARLLVHRRQRRRNTGAKQRRIVELRLRISADLSRH